MLNRGYVEGTVNPIVILGAVGTGDYAKGILREAYAYLTELGILGI